MTDVRRKLCYISEYHSWVLIFSIVVIMCLYNIFSTLLVVFEVKMPTLDTVYMEIEFLFKSCDADTFSKTIKSFGTKHRAIFLKAI